MYQITYKRDSFLDKLFRRKNHPVITLTAPLDQVLKRDKSLQDSYTYALEQKDEDGQNLYYPSKILADIPSEFGNSRLYIPSNFNNRFNGPIRFKMLTAGIFKEEAI